MEMDRVEFLKVMLPLQEIFQPNLSKEALEIYYRVLCRYTIDELKYAAGIIFKEHIYPNMPKPAEFIEIISTRKIKQGNFKEQPKLWQIPDEAQLKKIREMVQGVVNKCEGKK